MEENVVMVKLWGMSVGYLSWDKKNNWAIFEYEPDFLDKGLNIAPLTMPINAPRSLKHMPWLGDKEKLYMGLPPAFADSLPDKWGDSLFSAWLRDNHISTKKITPVDHLSFIGSRAMGAFEYEPAQSLGNNSTFSVDTEKLYAFAKQVLNERESTVLNAENSILWQDLIKISSSPGGKRPKAIVAINETTGEVVSGQGDVPEGFEHYILKYDDNSVYPLAKLEYVYYQMASECGIKMMPSKLQSYGNVTHFLTRRFDRIGNKKIHTQTFAAISPGGNSYEELFAVIRKLNLPYEDNKQQYLQLVFNVLSRNIDDHNKNFSFCMTPEGVWRLSSAYDLTYSVDTSTPIYMNQHSMSINGKTEEITYKDLEKVAQDNDIQDYNSLIEKVDTAIHHFKHFASELEIDKKLIETIEANFVKL
ncbi:type II toxin-antitoxin system HipA family toxin [uncultured Bacteroides sp.]|uniref:type II toxin-antitoxin system HipA family toxin n=1 Tax=uncultured Bacteroides sp. TaxID=162156 RepID=UPI002AAA6ABE|nr:type II toxin-antitoxin system HipA family toxin [uncultured Bacteroides sp.]